MTTPDQIQQEAKAIRWLVVGSLIAEYGAMLLSADRGELKMRANAVIRDSRGVQNYFRYHPKCSPESKKIFETEFTKNEIIAIAELVEVVWGFDEQSIEDVIKAVKQNTCTI
jgi:hypothetical protein